MRMLKYHPISIKFLKNALMSMKKQGFGLDRMIIGGTSSTKVLKNLTFYMEGMPSCFVDLPCFFVFLVWICQKKNVIVIVIDHYVISN